MSSSPFAPPAEAPASRLQPSELAGWMLTATGFAIAWGIYLGALGAWDTAEALATFGEWDLVPKVLAPHLVASHGPSAACLATAVLGMILARNDRPVGRGFALTVTGALYLPASLAALAAATWWLQRVPHVDATQLVVLAEPWIVALGVAAALARGALLAVTWPWLMGWHARGASVWWSVPAVLAVAVAANSAVENALAWAH